MIIIPASISLQFYDIVCFRLNVLLVLGPLSACLPEHASGTSASSPQLVSIPPSPFLILLFSFSLFFLSRWLFSFRLVAPHLSDSTPSRLVVSYSEYTRFIVPFRSHTAHFLPLVLFSLSLFPISFSYIDALHFFHPPIIADLSPLLASLVGYHILNSPPPPPPRQSLRG